MAAEHGSSDRASSKRRQRGDGGEPSDSPGRMLSPARARESASGPTVPTVGDSPKRFTTDDKRSEAASPIAPTQDMSLAELIHASQHLAAQSALDKQRAGRVEMAIADHALWLDMHKAAGNDVAARLDSMADHLASAATTTNTAGATAGSTGATAGATADNGTAPDAADVALRAHVKAQDAAMGARLDAAEAGLPR